MTKPATLKIRNIQPGSRVGILDRVRNELLFGFIANGPSIDVDIMGPLLSVSVGDGPAYAMTAFDIGIHDRFYRRQKDLTVVVRKVGWLPLHIETVLKPPATELHIVQICDRMLSLPEDFQVQPRVT